MCMSLDMRATYIYIYIYIYDMLTVMGTTAKVQVGIVKVFNAQVNLSVFPQLLGGEVKTFDESEWR